MSKVYTHLRILFLTLRYIFSGVKREVIGKGNSINFDHSKNYPDLKNLAIKINGNNNKIYVGRGTQLHNTKIEIHGDEHLLKIGEYCRISGSFFWMEDCRGEMIVGKKTTMERENKICVTEADSKIAIGEDCMFAYGVSIRCGDSHSIIDLVTSKRINFASDISIANHVWIGTNAQILKGVSIGNNAIIAAGAVVTKEVPDHTLAAGVPAKVKKQNVTWDRKKLME